MEHCELSDEKVARLLSALETHPDHLHTLSFRGNGLTTVSACRVMLWLIRINPHSIESVDLGDNPQIMPLLAQLVLDLVATQQFLATRDPHHAEVVQRKQSFAEWKEGLAEYLMTCYPTIL